jgi:hypothetical protein
MTLREYAPLLAVFPGHDGRRHDGLFADVGAITKQVEVFTCTRSNRPSSSVSRSQSRLLPTGIATVAARDASQLMADISPTSPCCRGVSIH